MDIGMPNEDGYEAIGKVRQLPSERGGKVPAIALGIAGQRSQTRHLERFSKCTISQTGRTIRAHCNGRKPRRTD